LHSTFFSIVLVKIRVEGDTSELAWLMFLPNLQKLQEKEAHLFEPSPNSILGILSIK
jgi:hypothetical protein